MTKRRPINFLPAIHQTGDLKRFFGATVDQVFQAGRSEAVSGYIGRKPAHYDEAKDFYKAEPTTGRTKYQLEATMVGVNEDGSVKSALFYDDLINAMRSNGALVENHDRLFESDYYSWAPPIDFDKLNNFQQYYWSDGEVPPLPLYAPGIEVPIDMASDGVRTEYDIPPALPSRSAAEEAITVVIDGSITSAYTLFEGKVHLDAAAPKDALISIYRYGNVSDGIRVRYPIPAKIEGLVETLTVLINGVATTDYAIDGDEIVLGTVPIKASHVLVTRYPDLRAIIEGKKEFSVAGFTLESVAMLYTGMRVELIDAVTAFRGFDIKPYDEHEWDELRNSIFVVEGVGLSIKLVSDEDEDAILKDHQYIVIDRRSQERSPWTRRNRWVHRDALLWNGSATRDRKARRPIIEYLPNIRLFNYGSSRVDDVDFTVTDQVRLTNGADISVAQINGMPNGTVLIQGDIPIRPGMRLLISQNDGETLTNNRVFRVATATQMDGAVEIDVFVLMQQGEPEFGQTVLSKDSNSERWFNGAEWVSTQGFEDGAWPLFDLYDSEGISLADSGMYPETTFAGSRLFGYAVGTGAIDDLVGVALTRDAYGEIVFENDLVTRRFDYDAGEIIGFYYYATTLEDGSVGFSNGWHMADTPRASTLVDGEWTIPMNLQANPDYDQIETISRNDWFEHFNSIMTNQDGFTGVPYGVNNWANTPRALNRGTEIIQHRAPLLKLMMLASNQDYSVTDAIRYAETEYSRFRAKFLQRTLEMHNDGLLRDSDGAAVWCSMILDSLKLAKNENFAFALSEVGGGQFFIPPTPAYLGILPAVAPKIVVDDSFAEPASLIRGHDGSLTVLFDDVRDDCLMALEARIYASIPEDFKAIDRDPLFLEARFVSGRFRAAHGQGYSYAEASTMLMPFFERWAQVNGIDYRANAAFDQDDPFTWNYSSVWLEDGTQLPGNWRGIYRLFFDTEQPQATPWEMLGFADQPDWWERLYGEAPYTRGNTQMWEDIAAGIIAEGDRAGVDLNYVRPGLLNILPVDESGSLLDPIAAKVAPYAPSMTFARRGWKSGDGAPVERLWRMSPAFSFAQAALYYLLKPARFVEDCWDTGNRILVHGHQWVHRETLTRSALATTIVHGETDEAGARIRQIGLQTWIAEYMIGRGQSPALLGDDIRSLRVQLGHKMAGFTTTDRLRASTENFGLIPDADISIAMYRSPSIREDYYSGVIIERNDGGWRVIGYNPNSPEFTMLEPDTGNKRAVIGLTDTVEAPLPAWRPNTNYSVNILVEYEDAVYRAQRTHMSSATFDLSYWTLDRAASRSRTRVFKYLHTTGNLLTVPYGTVFSTRQEVADFLIGYEMWLVSRGFVFTSTNSDDGNTSDWTSAVRSYLVWAEANLADGNFLALSPSAERLEYVADRGVVLNFETTANGSYGLIDRAGFPIDPAATQVDRFEGEVTVVAQNAEIFGARVARAEIEHALLFSNVTIFNDLIYSPLLNLRQDRIKLSAQRASDWAGRYDAPGYVIIDNEIRPSFEKASDDLRTMFDIERADNGVLRDHARHVIGYQSRDYLDNLLMSETQQFEFYQGMIQNKGTAGSFNKLLRSSVVDPNRDLRFHEEWAFRIGEFGAYNPRARLEMVLSQSQVRREPQYVSLASVEPSARHWMSATPSSGKWVSPVGDFSGLQSAKFAAYPRNGLPTAGYARLNEVHQTAFRMADVNTLIQTLATAETPIAAGTRLWVYETDNGSWDVFRLDNLSSSGSANTITRIARDFETDLSSGELVLSGIRVYFASAHGLTAGDIGKSFIINGASNTEPDLIGINKIVAVDSDWIEIEIADDDQFITDGYDFAGNDEVGPGALMLRSMRVANQTGLSAIPAVTGDIAYVDSFNGGWAAMRYDGTWAAIRTQGSYIDTGKVASALLYSLTTAITDDSLSPEPVILDRVNVIDPVGQGLIAGTAEREIELKIEYDPARYISGRVWGNDQVGMLWWDISQVRFVDPYTDDISALSVNDARYIDEIDYRSTYWGRVAPGTSVDIYEWTRSTMSPSEYLSEELGTPYGGENAPYVVAQEYDRDLARTATVYYFWVRNPTEVPFARDRRLSAYSCATMIENPTSTGLSWMAPIAPQGILVSGISSVLDEDSSVLQIETRLTDYDGREHQQWVLMRPEDENSLPPAAMWSKLRDSLVGFDDRLKPIPDLALHPSFRIGVNAQQSMFAADASKDARRSFVDMLNYIMARTDLIGTRYGVVDAIDRETPVPEYLMWAQNVSESSVAPLPLPANYTAVAYSGDERDALLAGGAKRVLLDGISTDSPFWSVWTLEDGKATVARAYDREISSMSELSSIGDEFVLLRTSPQTNGFWTIWTRVNGEIVCANAQTYRTRDFWDYVDWYGEGYDASSAPAVHYATSSDRAKAEGTSPSNTLVRIDDDGNGAWAWESFVDGTWTVVARERGTVQLSDAFYADREVYGWSNGLSYDLSKIAGRDGSFELRTLIDAIRDERVITDAEVNELWFSMVHFIHSVQDQVDWAFKTSFLTISGYNEPLRPTPVVAPDNTTSILAYLEEVTPYRVKTRDFVRTMTPDRDDANVKATDFDKPPYWDSKRNRYRSLDPKVATDATIIATNEPWATWGSAYQGEASPVRKFKIELTFDRIWAAAIPGGGAAERIVNFYQPGAGMRESNLDDLLKLDFKGTILDGHTLAGLSDWDIAPFDTTPYDTIPDDNTDVHVRGSDGFESTIDINPDQDNQPGIALRDPQLSADRPEELISVGFNDGLILRGNDRWSKGGPIHTVKLFDVTRRKGNSTTLDHGAIAQSAEAVAVFRDGVRARLGIDYTVDHLGRRITVNLTHDSGDRVEQAAVHAMGHASTIRVQSRTAFVFSGNRSFKIPGLFNAVVEVVVNGQYLAANAFTVSGDTVTLASNPASNADVLITVYDAPSDFGIAPFNALPFDSMATAEDTVTRMRVQNLTYNAQKTWTLAYPSTLDNRPEASATIVEVNGLRLAPMPTYYSEGKRYIFLNTTPSAASKVKIVDNAFRSLDGTYAVDWTDLGVPDSQINSIEDVLTAAGNIPFILWEGMIVFNVADFEEKDFLILIEEGHGYTVEAGVLKIVAPVTAMDAISVTTFTNNSNMGIRTHVFRGELDGTYRIATTSTVHEMWVTLDGKRLVGDRDYTVTYQSLGGYDIEAWDTIEFDQEVIARIVVRNPPIDNNHVLIATSFEGKRATAAQEWQVATTTPDIARLVADDDGDRPFVMVESAWETVMLDGDHRGGAVTAFTGEQIDINLNPDGLPSKLIARHPLPVPDLAKREPGVIWVGDERIEYFGYARNGDAVTLTQLRRGTRGSSRGFNHTAGTRVYAGDVTIKRPPLPPV